MLRQSQLSFLSIAHAVVTIWQNSGRSGSSDSIDCHSLDGYYRGRRRREHFPNKEFRAMAHQAPRIGRCLAARYCC
jgi:hypothetical protein